ncbi:MAG: cupin domain-containing protein [bacterium]|nr:cupin domain-containing protein [bacterium]
MAYVFSWEDGEILQMDNVQESRGWRILVDEKNAGSRFMSMGNQDIPVGTSIPVHIHEKEEEILFFHEGEAELEIDGNIYPVKAGMSCFLPAKVPHGLKNTGDTPLKMLWFFAPAGYEKVFREMASQEMDHGEIEKHL